MFGRVRGDTGKGQRSPPRRRRRTRRAAPVGLEPAGSVKISYMPTHARARRAAAGQPPEAIVPRLHACMHGRQSMQHAREGGIMARRRPSTRALALPRTTSNIGALTSNTQHDSMAGPAMIPRLFFPRPEPAAPVPQPSGLPEKEVGSNECATGEWARTRRELANCHGERACERAHWAAAGTGSTRGPRQRAAAAAVEQVPVTRQSGSLASSARLPCPVPVRLPALDLFFSPYHGSLISVLLLLVVSFYVLFPFLFYF